MYVETPMQIIYRVVTSLHPISDICNVKNKSGEVLYSKNLLTL